VTLIASYTVSLNTPSGAGTYQGEFYVWLRRQNVEANTSVIGWEFAIRRLSGTGRWSFETNNWAVVVNGDIVDYGNLHYDFREYVYLTVSSGEVTVVHGVDGAKAINAYANFDDDAVNLQAFSIGNSNPTGIPITSIPRGTLPKVTPSPATEGSVATITLDRAVNTYTHDLTWSCGTKSGTIATGVATGTTWTIPTDLTEEYPGRPLAPVTITAVTRNGATVIGTRSVTLLVREDPGPIVIGGGDFPFDIRIREVTWNGANWKARRPIPADDIQIVHPHSATATCSFRVSDIVLSDFEDFSIVDLEANNGLEWVNLGLRFVLSRVEEDRTDPARMAQYSGTNFVDFMLGRAYTQKDYEWESASPGTILKTLIDDAKARSWGPRIGYDFSAAETSWGVAWTNTSVKREIKAGTPILQVLEGLVEDGLVEYTTRYSGDTAYLEVLNPGSGSDWSSTDAQPVVNLSLVELSSAPRRGTVEERITRVTVTGDNDLMRTRERTPTDPVVFGQLEGWLQASGVEDATEADRIGDHAIEESAAAIDERTFEFSPNAVDRHVWPYFTVRPGDWVLIPGVDSDDDKPERSRVGQLTLSKRGDERTATILTGERILSATGQLAKRQKAATGGAIPGGTLQPPASLDSRIPAAPSITSLTSTGYWDITGTPKATLDIQFTPVSTSITGSALLVDYYEVWWRPGVATPWALLTVSDQNEILHPGWNIDSDVQLRVRGRSAAGVFGAWSDFVLHTTGRPGASLGAPDVPIVTANALGTINAEWDGDISGAPAPAHLAYVRAEISPTGGAPWSVFGTPLVSAGSTSVDPGLYQEWWIRLVPVDTLGQDGTPSAPVSITTTAPEFDPKVPEAPTGLTVDTDADWNDDGTEMTAWADLAWDAVTVDTNADPITVVVYEVWAKRPTDAGFTMIGTSTAPSVRVTGLTVDSDYVWGVTAVSALGVRSDMSATVSEATPDVTSGLGAPDAPSLASSRGTMRISWNGMLAGAPPPAWFRYVYAEFSEHGENDWVRVGSVFMPGGGDVIVSLNVGSEYDVRLTAVDALGAESAASSITTTTVTGVGITDLDDVLNTFVTEPRIETTSEADRGVKLFSDGIVAYNSSGEPTFIVNAEDGSLYFANATVSGNAIINNTIDASKINVGSMVTALIQADLAGQLDLTANESVNIRINTAVDAAMEPVNKAFEFTEDGLTIKSADSRQALNLDNDGIAMLVDGSPISWWTNEGFMVDVLTVRESANIGAHVFSGEGTPMTHTTVRLREG